MILFDLRSQCQMFYVAGFAQGNFGRWGIQKQLVGTFDCNSNRTSQYLYIYLSIYLSVYMYIFFPSLLVGGHVNSFDFYGSQSVRRPF